MDRFLKNIQSCLRRSHYEWRKHSLVRMAERSITQEETVSAVMKGKVIEMYEKDRPFPSALILGFCNKRPLHVVAALDESEDFAYVITVYEPSLIEFGKAYDKRR